MLRPPCTRQKTSTGAEKVQTLMLDHNRLSAVPPGLIERFRNITSLCLHDNELSELPPDIGELVMLVELRLDRNALTALPREIVKLTSLSVLHVPDNRLATLPAELAQLPALRELLFCGNPFDAGLPLALSDLDVSVGVWLNFPD